MIWSCSANGFLTYLSPEWEFLTGQDAGQALGEAWRSVLHPDDLETIAKDFCQARAARVSFTLHFRVQSTETSFVNLVCSATPLFVSRQRILAGYVGAIMRDECQRRVPDANIIGRAVLIDLSEWCMPMPTIAKYLRLARAKAVVSLSHTVKRSSTSDRLDHAQDDPSDRFGEHRSPYGLERIVVLKTCTIADRSIDNEKYAGASRKVSKGAC